MSCFYPLFLFCRGFTCMRARWISTVMMSMVGFNVCCIAVSCVVYDG